MKSSIAFYHLYPPPLLLPWPVFSLFTCRNTLLLILQRSLFVIFVVSFLKFNTNLHWEMSLPGLLPVWAPLATVSVRQGRRFPHLSLGMNPLIFQHLAIFPPEEQACPCSQSILSYWLAHEQWRYHHFAPTTGNSEAMAFWTGFAWLC